MRRLQGTCPNSVKSACPSPVNLSQPGTLSGWRKMFSSPTQPLTIWAGCLQTEDSQSSTRCHSRLASRSEALSSLPSEPEMAQNPVPGFSSGRQSVSKASHCPRDGLCFTESEAHYYSKKRKSAAHFTDTFLSGHQHLGTSPSERCKSVCVCMCIFRGEGPLTLISKMI